MGTGYFRGDKKCSKIILWFRLYNSITILKISDSCTLNEGTLWYENYIFIKMFLKFV